jgi:hypothetical protein
MEAQATEKRCGKCMKSPKQCGTCKNNAKMQELRKIKKDTGVDDPRLRRHREKNSQTKREQRESASANGYTYNKRRLCKGPDQLVEGSDVSTCTKVRVSDLSRNGSSFCAKCFDKAFGRDARLLLKPPVRNPQCVGLGHQRKLCSNRIPPEKGGIRAALRKTGMKPEAFRAATQKAGGLKSLVEAFKQSKQCLSCFQITYPNWADVLRQFTQCIFEGVAGVRCQRTAYVEGLCDTHHVAKLPPAKTRCSDIECSSGEPGVRKGKKVGRCQPCLDAMYVAAKRKAAEIPAVECPTRGKRQKR